MPKPNETQLEMLLRVYAPTGVCVTDPPVRIRSHQVYRYTGGTRAIQFIDTLGQSASFDLGTGWTFSLQTEQA
ncbi:MAG: hypothetical protein IT406_00985 [Candidatus Yanofskybacteria bacterium]|nr:hypothetical protein [Candidatus Yanofskybacteria bacterium]